MKFLFFPSPAHGHVNPMLPLARELVSRGDEVLIYLTREFEAVVRATGATHRALDDAFGIPLLPGIGGNPPDMMRALPLILKVTNQGLREAPRLAEQARAERADGVLYDPMALWGIAVAGMLRLPSAIFNTTFVGTPLVRRELRKNFKTRPPLKSLLGILGVMWTSEVLHWRHGAPRTGLLSAFSAVADLHIVPIPRSYQPDAGSLDARYVFVGPSVTSRGDRGDFPLEQLEGSPVLYISLGTTPLNQRTDFYTACFQAFRDTPWKVVMACGRNLDPASLGAAPPNFIVRQQVPQLEVLSRARVMLTHGGMNSIMESLWYGVPLAVFPQAADQPFNARRVGELGLGIALTAHEALDPKALRDTLERLDTEPAYRERVTRFQKELREAGGAQRAADALHQFVATRQGAHRKSA